MAESNCNYLGIDGIYVRVYEDRMDLLRAVIVGAYGTPYQDGLFFFDFHLPPEYPDVPPVREIDKSSLFYCLSFLCLNLLTGYSHFLETLLQSLYYIIFAAYS